MLNEKEGIKVKGDIVLREEDEGAFLFDPDTGRICYLNELGVVIWKLFNGSKTLTDIIEVISLDYPDISGEQIKNDCYAFMENLGKMGFLSDETDE